MLSHPLANQKAVCIELQQVDYRERLYYKFNIIFSLKRQVPGYKKVFCKSPVKKILCLEENCMIQRKNFLLFKPFLWKRRAESVDSGRSLGISYVTHLIFFKGE